MWRLVSGQPTCIETEGPVDIRLKPTYGDPTMFLEPLSASRSSRIPATEGTDHKFSFKTTVPHEMENFVVPILLEVC